MYVGKSTVRASSGVHQGPLLPAPTIHRMSLSLRAWFPELIHACNLDDGTLMGKVVALGRDLHVWSMRRVSRLAFRSGWEHPRFGALRCRCEPFLIAGRGDSIG